MLSESTPASNSFEPSRGKERVASVLINPEPLNTGTELRVCKTEGEPPLNDDDDDKNGGRESFFARNDPRNQVCIENSLELQNYALQFEYYPSASPLSGSSSKNPRQQLRIAVEEAAAAMQAFPGENVLGLSDYLVFSPKDTAITGA